MEVDPERADRLGANGREDLVADFGWDVIAGRLADVYESVQGMVPRRA